jgi:molybdenum cofactor biosynthesis enzyme MoaA
LKPCLLGEKEVSVKGLLRGGASDEEIVKAIRETVEAKPTRHPARRTFPMSKVGG